MFITIGILAYNESETIAQTVESLFQQSVFHVPDEHHWQVVIVPNGCTDNTAAVAEEALVKAIAAAPRDSLSHSVHSLARGGKSNAWNELIHSIAAPETDVFVMIDADIEFGEPDTIRNSLRCLVQNPHAMAVCDLPLKDFTRKRNLTFVERLSARASRVDSASPVGIAGSFYCARAAILRSVWMPVGLSVEDGFLAAMLTTDFFRSEPDPSRIVRAPNATHYFTGLTQVRAVVQHEVRLVIGTMLNAYLCWDALMFLTDPKGPGAGPLVKALNENKPDWYARMMSNQMSIRGRWLFSSAMVFRRFGRLRNRPLLQRVKQLPWATMAFAFDVLVFWLANQKMRSGRAIGYW